MMRRSPLGNKPPARPAKQWTADELPGPRVPMPSSRELYGNPRMVQPIPKDNPTRDEAYRRLVAALPCCNCGIEGFSQAAHGPTLGAGIKASDADVFPLCCDRPGVKGCHARFDQYELFDSAVRAVKARQWGRRTRQQLEGQTA